MFTLCCGGRGWGLEETSIYFRKLHTEEHDPFPFLPGRPFFFLLPSGRNCSKAGFNVIAKITVIVAIT